MIPQQLLSGVPVPTLYLTPDDATYHALIDYERGGTALHDAGTGMNVRTWRLFLDGNDVKIDASGVAAAIEFSGADITELSLAFDQNMNPVIAYVQASAAKLYYYDTVLEAYTHLTLAAGVTSPRVCLDDKRALQNAASDVILAYLRAGNLYFRAQRDRYLVEYLLKTGVSDPLRKVGMNKGNRLQFEF